MLIISVSPVLAESGDDGIDAIAITVIIPPVNERPTPPATARRLFPVNVAEGYNYEGVRELRRIYELMANESPEWINTDSFTRNGYYYQLAEITRQVNVAHTVREHTEIVEIPSSTNNLAAVIAELNPTMDFADEDGYAGLLHLDIRSIEMTQDGTRSTSRTVSQTREYPHLSNPDLALIPQTITANGRTYTLGNVDWRTNTSAPIDFNSVPQTFTAVATYTRTATSTVSTGYTTVAAYSGLLTRVSTGDVRFVATFIGTPIVSPMVNRPAPSNELPTYEQETEPYEFIDEKQAETEIETPTVYPVGNGGNENGSYDNYIVPTIPEAETVQEVIQEPDENSESSGILPLLMILAIPVALIILALVLLMLRFKKKADTLENFAHEDSAHVLRSRMTRIVNRDRKELAKHADYEDDEPDDFSEGEDFEDFVTGYDNSDEDGDD